MSIGTFALVRNENQWIAAHILRVLPFVDEMVFYDGNSTDGTLQIILDIIHNDPNGHKVKLFTGMDPKDLKDDYVRLFDECLRSLSTDLAFFAHPDMYVANPSRLLDIKDSGAVALTTAMRSFAGEPGGQLYEIKGRQQAWKNIYRLRNPDLGAHYFGHYGAASEDVYFSAITGTQHIHHGHRINLYPYEVESSGLEVLHFSDVRTYERRLGRMKACLLNQVHEPSAIESIPATHPRVTLKSGPDNVGNHYEFIPSEYPVDFLAARAKYSHLERSLELVKA